MSRAESAGMNSTRLRCPRGRYEGVAHRERVVEEQEVIIGEDQMATRDPMVVADGLLPADPRPTQGRSVLGVEERQPRRVGSRDTTPVSSESQPHDRDERIRIANDRLTRQFGMD